MAAPVSVRDYEGSVTQVLCRSDPAHCEVYFTVTGEGAVQFSKRIRRCEDDGVAEDAALAMWELSKGIARQEAKQEISEETKQEDSEVAAAAEESAAGEPSQDQDQARGQGGEWPRDDLEKAVVQATFRPDLDDKVKQEIKN